MKKVVLKLDLHNNKDKQKAMKGVSGLTGINSLDIDMKERKMTVIGEVDPVDIVSKLRKHWYVEILTVGPPKEEGKKDEPKKDEAKDDAKKEGDGNKKKDEKDQIAELVAAYKAYYERQRPAFYRVASIEEDPNACVIS